VYNVDMSGFNDTQATQVRYGYLSGAFQIGPILDGLEAPNGDG